MQLDLAGEVVDAVEGLGTGAADDAVDFVALFEKEFREITAVLPRDAGDECPLHVRPSWVRGVEDGPRQELIYSRGANEQAAGNRLPERAAPG